MDNELKTQPHGIHDVEIQEWLESLDSVLESSGPEVAAEILERLRAHATVNGVPVPDGTFPLIAGDTLHFH